MVDHSSTISVVVRFHSLARLSELRRCLFSLLCQSYQPLEICLATQRFTPDEIARLEASLEPLRALNPAAFFHFVHYSDPQPADARSVLINLGIKSSRGRYLAFLDYDDTILPSSYELLINELQRSSAAIAFASIAYKDAEVFEDTLLVNRRLEAFVGKDLRDLFDHNFCPIHSFVVDCSRVSPAHLYFDQSLTRHEDYEFLLRLCAEYRSSFHLIGTFAGDYYLKTDGSNSNQWLSGGTIQSLHEWDESSQYLNQRKSEIRLSALVQQQLGLAGDQPDLTIADFLRDSAMPIIETNDHS